MKLISVIVTTYNWPTALQACLHSLFTQVDQQFEIIVADDGSRPDTAALIQQLAVSSPVPLSHCYQADEGFRAAMIRNKAVAQSQGDYLVFLDGDCVVLPTFIQRHRKLAQKGCFVPGNRVLLSKDFTSHVLNSELALATQPFRRFVKWRLQGKINRLLPLLTLPLGPLRLAKPQDWQKAMTCNLGVWRDDFIKVNGFDELFAGWGYEDSDLVIRLLHAGTQRKEGRFALPVLHLWHPYNDRQQHDVNYQRLQERLQQPHFSVALKGVTQYLS